MDYMVELLTNMQKSKPELARLFDSILQLYQKTSMPKMDLDTRFLFYPPGHYYSPLPSSQEYERIKDRIYGCQHPLAGIDLQEEEQLLLFYRLVKWYSDMPFTERPQEGMRYYFDNEFFLYADGFWLYAMMREYKPKRIIEIGSGFSSSLMLDMAERYFHNDIQFTFIEPDPKRLYLLLRPGEKRQISLFEQPVQEVPLQLFDSLKAGDFLFIDSSHVGKFGSDVLYELHTILPRLKPGVLIHFHDIFYPFEYPRAWLEQGRAWNECYFLHTFLQYNSTFIIKLFGNYLGQKHSELLAKAAPLCLKNIGGSLWLEKVI